MPEASSSDDEGLPAPAPKFRLADVQRTRARRSFDPMNNVVINTSLCKYSMVRKVASESGWSEAEEGRENWHVFWTDLSVSHPRVKALTPLQRINHFPDMTRICHKAESAIVLKSLLRYFHSEYHFFPQSWSLPKETAALHAFMRDDDATSSSNGAGGGAGGAGGGPLRRRRSGAPPKFILKPNKGCQGADIMIISSPAELDEARQALGVTTGCVVQECVTQIRAPLPPPPPRAGVLSKSELPSPQNPRADVPPLFEDTWQVRRSPSAPRRVQV